MLLSFHSPSFPKSQFLLDKDFGWASSASESWFERRFVMLTFLKSRISCTLGDYGSRDQTFGSFVHVTCMEPTQTAEFVINVDILRTSKKEVVTYFKESSWHSYAVTYKNRDKYHHPFSKHEPSTSRMRSRLKYDACS
jgi:hypothetical protein